MRTPACNFILLHCTFGITILSMSVMAMTNKVWRRNYGFPFYCFTIFHGLHTMPASWINDAGFMPLFMVACILEIIMALFGIFDTLPKLKGNPTNKQLAQIDKELAIQYAWITFINAAAALLEAPNISKAFNSKAENGVFDIIKEGPHKLYGNTPYDIFPEKIGMGLSLAFSIACWLIWPIFLVTLDSAKKTAA